MYESIKEQFAEVIAYSQSIPNPQIDDLFDKWATAKKKFIERFGGLIYEWPEPVEFELDKKTQKSQALEFSDLVCNVYNNPDLSAFIEDNLDSFYDNKVLNSKYKEIPIGMKLLKSFKHFEKNEETLHRIQDLASSLIQGNKIKGKLCFSVHPLDFLSSSCNNYNWRSCHSLDGDYRAGNLSYMVDKTTFMIYLKGDDNKIIPLFPKSVPWNSKKWRVLVYASENDYLMFAGRQYPFNSSYGLQTALDIYNNLVYADTRATYCEWKDFYYNSFGTKKLDYRYFEYDGELVPIEKCIQNAMCSTHFNDVLISSCYEFPNYTILNPGSWWHSVGGLLENPIIVGGAVECLHCGKETIEMPETMRCSDCELRYGYEENESFVTCECCGTRIWFDDSYTVNDYYDVCSNCFQKEAFVCEDCGNSFFNEEKQYIPNYGEVCSYCYNRYLEQKDEV